MYIPKTPQKKKILEKSVYKSGTKKLLVLLPFEERQRRNSARFNVKNPQVVAAASHIAPSFFLDGLVGYHYLFKLRLSQLCNKTTSTEFW